MSNSSTTTTPPKIEHERGSRVVRIDYDIDYLPVDDGALFVTRIVQREDAGTPEGVVLRRSTEPVESEMVLRAEEFASLRETGDYAVEDLVVLDNEIIEYIRLYGVQWTMANKQVWPERNEALRLPFSSLASGKMTAHNLYRLDTSNSLLFDRHGKRMPNAIFFDYLGMSGYMSSLCYDIDKAAAHLRRRPDILMRTFDCREDAMGARSEWSNPVYSFPPRPDDGENVIGAVPDICAAHLRLEFIWQPSKQDFDRVVAHMEETKSRNVYKAIFDLDILGLRAAGAALFDTYGQWGDVLDGTEDD